MVFVPGGTFLMGSSDTEVRAAYEEAKRIRDVDVFNSYSLEEFSSEKPKHQVTVSSFYMGKYEVTQAQYQAVMGTNSSSYKDDNLPVENVSWNKATEFCSKLSRMTGRKYRLPTEAEWEYACRAGTTGDYAGELDAMAWYRNNSGAFGPHPVGQKQPNGFRLYDMHGNVWEWCEDIWHENYNGAPSDGSAWLDGGDPKRRVFRGGSAFNFAISLRSAWRNSWEPNQVVTPGLGFRVVMNLSMRPVR